MKLVEYVTRKTFLIRFSGRSSDYITASFGYGCLFKCAYCYMRRHQKTGLSVAKNPNDVLTSVNNHAFQELFTQKIKKPNQTDDVFITYDISCNEDFALHSKYHNWKYIFEFFRTHQVAKATLATKHIPRNFLEFNPEKKVRIRFSLMPQKYSDILEPNTSKIIDRIKAVNEFIEAGYEVHLNFSPVIAHLEDSYDLYKELFELVDVNINDDYKKEVKAEVIFLTHNKEMHKYNLEHYPEAEELLWAPDYQEDKVSQYGGINLRYKRGLKKELIQKFVELHDEIIPWNFIRYIF